MADEVEVVDNEVESRYEAWIDGERAGLLTYRRRPGRISFIHTEIDDRFGGRGAGAQLVVTALDAARSAGLAILPFCPFVSAYIDRHPEYQGLIADGYRREPPPSGDGGRSGEAAPGGS